MNRFKQESENIAMRLSQAIRFATISYNDMHSADTSAFVQFRAWLQSSYPNVHQALIREEIDTHALLYYWKGQDSSLKPALFLAHQDVVPAEGAWQHPPFDGIIDDRYIWGRGALDMKGQLISLMEGAEALIKAGFIPKRDIYFAMSHNEETANETGAQTTAALLKQRGIELEFILDEGTTSILKCDMFNTDKPIATIGICEKGFAVLAVAAEDSGGHASTPPPSTAAGRVAAASYKIEKARQKPSIKSVSKEFFEAIAPNVKGFDGFMMKNLWLFSGILAAKLSKNRQSNALVRTTHACTMMQGSPAANVLPQKALICFNYRIAPWDDKAELLESAKKAADKCDVKIEFIKYSPPTQITATKSYGFSLLKAAIQEAFPDVVVAPSMMLAATDASHYQEVSQCILRFSPFRSYYEDKGRIHAANERIEIASLIEGCEFYYKILGMC